MSGLTGLVAIAALMASCTTHDSSATARLVEAVSGVPAGRSDAIAARIARAPTGFILVPR